MRVLPDRRPCGRTPGGYLRGHVLCVPGGRYESDAYVPAMLLPPDGGAPISIEEAGDSESPQGHRRQHLLLRREIAGVPAFGSRAIAWVEGDRLWAAPPPP